MRSPGPLCRRNGTSTMVKPGSLTRFGNGKMSKGNPAGQGWRFSSAESLAFALKRTPNSLPDTLTASLKAELFLRATASGTRTPRPRSSASSAVVPRVLRRENLGTCTPASPVMTASRLTPNRLIPKHIWGALRPGLGYPGISGLQSGRVWSTQWFPSFWPFMVIQKRGATGNDIAKSTFSRWVLNPFEIGNRVFGTPNLSYFSLFT